MRYEDLATKIIFTMKKTEIEYEFFIL